MLKDNKFSKISWKKIIDQFFLWSTFILRKQCYLLPALVVATLLTIWFWKGPLSGNGGIPIFGRIEIFVPPFFQEDPLWGQEVLGKSTDTIASAGCALTSAAMVLHFYGVDVDPKKLNDYLIQHDGYEGAAWIKWEVAATFPPNIAEHRYEDLPSYGLIDWNLLRGNPVIVRIRRSTGNTHFVVLVGKQGFDYLVRDPAEEGKKGVYPFYELGRPIEALRFYSVLK